MDAVRQLTGQMRSPRSPRQQTSPEGKSRELVHLYFAGKDENVSPRPGHSQHNPRSITSYGNYNDSTMRGNSPGSPLNSS